MKSFIKTLVIPKSAAAGFPKCLLKKREQWSCPSGVSAALKKRVMIFFRE